MLIKLLVCLYIYEVSSLHVHVSELGPEKVIFDLKEAKELFEEFIQTFKKNYNKTEYEYRLEIFKNNLKDVNNRNKNTSSEVYGITQFFDLTTDEFIRDHTGFKRDFKKNLNEKDYYVESIMHLQRKKAPEHWDWRQQGVVTSVKNQGSCQSCWSFSAVGCVESQYAKKYKKLYTLSEQQLVDCFPRGGGCVTGSFPHLALNAAAKMGGFMAQSDYPYVDRKGSCRFDRRRAVVQVKGGRQVRSITNEEQLKTLVYNYGPVSVAVSAFQGFIEYRGGIATARGLGCNAYSSANHAVLLVGYGKENGNPFWIIKNSHGRVWGEQGYMKLIRGQKACAILDYVSVADMSWQ